MRRRYQCKYCKAQIPFYRNGKKMADWQRKDQVFCSRKCQWAYQSYFMKRHPEYTKRLQTPEVRARANKNIRKAWANMSPEIKKRMSKASSERMKKKNPSHDPKVIAKAKETKRINGTLHIWSGKRGGNGSFTEPQKLLAVALGWQMEVAITLADHIPEGQKRKYTDSRGLPTCYKVDIGNPNLKIAIEVDGELHQSAPNILLDQKKTKALTQLGWKVLRFTNEEVMTNLSQVLLEIKKEIKAL